MIAALAVPSAAEAQKCVYTTIDRFCVDGGIYRIVTPPGDGPFPVVVYLYGSGGLSREIIGYEVFKRDIVSRGYALIVPAAKDLRYEDGRGTGWSLRNERVQVRDEVAFLKNVLADAARRTRLDRNRVLFVGQSRGGFLIWEIACNNPEMASAYAVHAGGYLGELPARCKGPVHFLHGHGKRDRIVPLRNASWTSAGARMAPLQDSLNLIARANGCQMTERPRESRYYGMLRRSWQNCTSRRKLDFLLHDGGHNPPPRWFPAVLDWFEAAKAQEIPPRAVSRTVGDRRSGQGSRFKSIPKRSAAQ